MADPKVSLKISKHPTKPNSYLVSPIVTVPFEGELPVKPYVLPRTGLVTLQITMDKSSQSEELGSIEYNKPASTVFEFSLPNSKKLVDTAVQCNVVMGKQEKEFWFQPFEDAEFDPEIIAKYYTQQYLNMVEQKIAEEQIIKILRELFNEINSLNLNEYQVIKDIKEKIIQTIRSLESNNVSALRILYTTTATDVTRVAGSGIRTQMSQQELVNIEGYNQHTQILEFNGLQFRVLTEDVNLNDIAKNGRLFISCDAAIHSREAIIFDIQSLTSTESARVLTGKITESDTLQMRLDQLCEFVRNNFNATDVEAIIKLFQNSDPQHVLKLNDSSEPIPCVPLEYFKQFHTGVCRHYAAFTAISIVHLIQARLLPTGTVRILRGTADNQKAHSWVHYHPKDGVNEHLIFLIDTTNPGQKVFVFDMRKNKHGEKDADLENAILNYRKRGLEELLIEMLASHEISLPNIPPSENYQVSEELIRAIQIQIKKEKRIAGGGKSKTEVELINAGVIDPISLEIIVEPVRTDDKLNDEKQDKKQVYDRAFIAVWLEKHNTSPNTGAILLSKTLTPAHDEVNRINGVLARLLGKVSSEEVNETIVKHRRAEFTEEAKLARLNERDNKVRAAIQNYEKESAQKSRDKHAKPISPAAASSSSSSFFASNTAVSSTPGSINPTGAAPQCHAQASVLPATMSLTPMSFSTPAAALSASAHKPSSRVPARDGHATNGNGIELQENSHQTQINHWLRGESAWLNIITAYYKKRGFRFFGYSSDASLELLVKIGNAGIRINDDITQAADNYLANENNKGKRLYDILIEEKVKAKKISLPQDVAINPNYIWLDENILYLIQQKYKLQRGCKISGNSSNESLALLDLLKDTSNTNDISEKQRAIESYIEKNKNDIKPKRLYKILIDLKNICSPDAPRDCCHPLPGKL